MTGPGSASAGDLFPVVPPRSGIVLTDDQRIAWLRLSRSDRVGPATFRELINQFGTATAAIDALPDLARRGGGKKMRIATMASIETELARANAIGARFIAMGEPDYPTWLVHAHAPPPVLTIRGVTKCLTRPAIAIVGARNASAAGRKIAATLARDIGAAGLTIVSGLARGIDAAAHQAATPTGTVGVFAGGIDVIYPTENEALLAAMLEAGGCAISEMPVGWTPRAQDFPRRNRIIAGMAMATIVIEAARRSGSLITARRALEQDREVMAVPGSPLDPRSAGTNDLIKNGARCITDANDVLDAVQTMSDRKITFDRHRAHRFEAAPAPPTPLEPESDARQTIIEALGPAPVDIDDVIRITGLASRIVSVVLLELDLAGRLHRHPGNRVSIL
ncbi:MAG: DNA-processing protein DprA [Alphaproteobacteria bacterium]